MHKGCSHQVITFECGNIYFCIDILYVKSLIRFNKDDITPVPEPLSFVEGLINIRSQLITLVSLRKRFKIESSSSSSQVIIINTGNLNIGLIVDSVERVISISDSDIEPPQSVYAGINKAYIKGIVKLNDTISIYLDIEKLFSEEEILKLENYGQ